MAQTASPQGVGENQSASIITEVKERSEQGKKNIKIFAIGFGGLVLAAVVVSALIGVYRVYAKVAGDPLSVAVAKIFRLPIAKVDGYSIQYSDYVSDLKAIHVMKQYDAASGGQGANLTEEQMSDQVVFRLVNNVLVKEAAAKYGLTVQPGDIDALKKQILTQFKTEDAASAELKKRYGWDMKTYEDRVMNPYVLQNKLAAQIESNAAAREQIRQKAEEVLAKIKGGADFAAMAKQYGQDGTSKNGGDLGWFGKGEMVPQFEAAAFALKKGELSSVVVESPYGYHIIKVDDIKTEKSKDQNGKTVDAVKIKARHILFLFPSVQDYLNGQLKQADIHLYVNMKNPFDVLKTKES